MTNWEVAHHLELIKGYDDEAVEKLGDRGKSHAKLTLFKSKHDLVTPPKDA